MSPTSRTIAAGLTGVALGALCFLTLCDLSFDCGCTWPGTGDWSHCDVFEPGPPDCPWCDFPAISAVVFLVASAAAFGGAWWGQRRPVVVAGFVAWVAFVVATLVAGVVTAVVGGRAVLAGF